MAVCRFNLMLFLTLLWVAGGSDSPDSSSLLALEDRGDLAERQYQQAVDIRHAAALRVHTAFMIARRLAALLAQRLHKSVCERLSWVGNASVLDAWKACAEWPSHRVPSS